MTTLRLRNGGNIDVEALPADPDDLTRAVMDADVVLDPLDGEEGEVDPACFLDEIGSYLRELLKTKNAPAPATFLEAGRIGETVYWIFAATLREETPLYAFVVRNIPVTEVFGAEQSASYLDPATGVVVDRVLTPAQAALLDFCLHEDAEAP
jgi:hypothetical protein